MPDFLALHRILGEHANCSNLFPPYLALLQYIQLNPGHQVKYYCAVVERSDTSVRQYLRKLQGLELIEPRLVPSKKSVYRYYVSQEGAELLAAIDKAMEA